MGLSAVSGYASTTFLTLGRAVLPIAADVVTVLAVSHMTFSYKMVFSVSSLAGLATLYGVSSRRWSASTMLSCCVYGGYKLFQIATIYRNQNRRAARINAMMSATGREERVHPSVSLLLEKSRQLQQRLTLTYEGPHVEVDQEFWDALDSFAQQNQEEVRNKWQDPETLRLANQLIILAASCMEALYAELETAAAQELPENRLKKMALDLTSPNAPYYYHRFCCHKTLTLLDIYRTVRGMRICIHCPRIDNPRFQNIVRDLKLQERDVRPFAMEAGRQAQWKKIYNETMDRFAPLMEEMRKFPESQQSDFKQYLNWAVRDDELFPADGTDKRANVFKLNPDSKP
jgi:hypothetical protein